MNIIDVIKSGDYVILDTETTGLGADAEICQIAIINSKGETLLDTLVKPIFPIPQDAINIHGITNEMVENASSFPFQRIQELIKGKNVIIYNSEYDVRVMNYCTPYGLQWENEAYFYCAMKHFAPIYGDWNDYRKSYRWKSLSVACEHYGIETKDTHSALGDCLLTLAVCRAMAQSEDTEK